MGEDDRIESSRVEWDSFECERIIPMEIESSNSAYQIETNVNGSTYLWDNRSACHFDGCRFQLPGHP